MKILSIVRLWAAAAWADGVLHPTEEAALRRLIDASADELGGEGRQQALALLAAPFEVGAGEIAGLAAHEREGVYRAALGIVRLDGKVTADEEEWVGRLRAQLGLDEATLARIERETT